MPTKPRKRKPPTQRHSAKFPPYTVFISHSSKDLFIAEQIVTLIEGSGANCKIDKRDFEGGGNIWDEINDTVDKSQEVVILLTTNSKNSDWVKFEMGAASQKAASQKRGGIIPILIIPILYGVEYKKLALIAGRIAVDLNTGFSKYITDLKKRIGEWEPEKG